MKTQFLASFPDIQSALKVGSDGMRIQLDIPETEIQHALALFDMRRSALRVTVEVVENAITVPKNGRVERD